MEAVTGLGFSTYDIEDRVDELGAFGVMAFGPVVTGAGLAEDEVVGAEDLAIGTGADAVHGARLQVHEDCPRDIAPAAGFVEVDIDALELQVRVAVVRARGVDPVLVAHHFPELGTDLVAALPTLDVQNLPHAGKRAVNTQISAEWR